MRMRKLARGRGRQLLGVSVFYLGWRLLKERSLSTPFCDSPRKAIMACFEPLPLMRMIYTNLPYITNLDSSNRLESNASLADVFALDHISVSMEKEDNSCCKICRVVGAWLLCYNSRLLLVSRSLTPRQESGYARLICFGGERQHDEWCRQFWICVQRVQLHEEFYDSMHCMEACAELFRPGIKCKQYIKGLLRQSEGFSDVRLLRSMARL